MTEYLSIIQKMTAVVTRALNVSEPSVFFPLLHEFTEYLQHAALKDALTSIANKYQSDVKQLTTLEAKALDELKNRALQFRNYLKTSCSNSQAILLLDSFEDKVKTRKQLDSSFITPFEYTLFQLLNDENEDHSPFLKKFGNIQQINDYKFINDEEIFPCFHEWQNDHTYFITQVRSKAAWFSLNQLIIFFERYDLRFYKQLIAELKKKGTNISRLQSEHIELIRYTFFGTTPPPNLFPTSEEYKIHMQRLLESLTSLEINTSPIAQESKYLCSYSSSTAQLIINNNPPIQFKINKDPANLLKTYFAFPKKTLPCLKAYNLIWRSDHDSKKQLESNDMIKLRDIVRQINNRLKRERLPSLFLIQESQMNPDEDIIHLSTQYSKK